MKIGWIEETARPFAYNGQDVAKDATQDFRMRELHRYHIVFTQINMAKGYTAVRR